MSFKYNSFFPFSVHHMNCPQIAWNDRNAHYHITEELLLMDAILSSDCNCTALNNSWKFSIKNVLVLKHCQKYIEWYRDTFVERRLNGCKLWLTPCISTWSDLHMLSWLKRLMIRGACRAVCDVSVLSAVSTLSLSQGFFFEIPVKLFPTK